MGRKLIKKQKFKQFIELSMHSCPQLSLHLQKINTLLGDIHEANKLKYMSSPSVLMFGLVSVTSKDVYFRKISAPPVETVRIIKQGNRNKHNGTKVWMIIAIIAVLALVAVLIFK